MTAPTCRYCNRAATWCPSSAHLYGGRDYGAVYECVPCGAWVGCHKNTKKPHRRSKGTPANEEDRELRKAAHAAFDPLWKRVSERDGISPKVARKRGYRWLAGELGLDLNECHIAMMHGAYLRAVIDACTPPFGCNGGPK